MATFSALYTEVLDHGFDATSYTSRVKTWLNEAQAIIARRLQIRELEVTSTVTTVAGTATASLPSGFIRMNGIVDEEYPRKLHFSEDPDELLVRNEGADYLDRPDSYSLTNAGILLSPVPDNAYTLTLDYWSRPTDMSADSDVSALPADYHFVMISYALSRAYRSEDDATMSQFFMQEFQRDLALMATDVQFQAREPRQVPGTWGDF
jgi:hypothetical protein